VLVTGAGAPGAVGTLHALRSNPDDTKLRIVACDMRPDVVGGYWADVFHVIPPAEAPEFIDSLLAIGEREDVDVILPQVTRELPPLSQAAEKFRARGIAVAVSSSHAIRRANDKWFVLEAAGACGVPYPETIVVCSEEELVRAAQKFGYPTRKVVVKPRRSNGMRGFRIVSSEVWDVRRFLEEKPGTLEVRLDDLISVLRRGDWPELLVQEYMPGSEYTVDVFRGESGVVAIPRLREEIRSGVTFRSRIEFREDLQTFCARLSEELDLRYAFGFQFRASEEGIPKVLECNPRVQGTMVAAVFAGSNLIWYAVKEAAGQTVSQAECRIPAHDVRLIRYWGAIAVHADGTWTGPI